MKQKRLYKLLPALIFVSCFKEETSVELIRPEYTVVEALDDANIEDQGSFSGEAFENLQSEKLVEVATRKIPQNQTSENSQKFQCECGLTLSNKFSLKRHVDRVSLT
jgi:hypothetical protein